MQHPRRGVQMCRRKSGRVGVLVGSAIRAAASVGGIGVDFRWGCCRIFCGIFETFERFDPHR